jgi:uncharacterized membrane protein
MGDSQVILDGESPLDSWQALSSPQPKGAPKAAGANQPAPQREEAYDPDKTRLDIPALSPHATGETPAPPHAQPPAQMTHAPWTVASSWGASSFNTPNTLAGMSYLFWWVSGLFVYFNERHNRFVRFHAVQSVLLTGVLTVVNVALYVLWELSADLSAATHQPAFAHVGQGIAFLGFLGVIGLWLGPMFAAWSGHHVRLPIVGAYAERYAAPPREEPYPPSPFAD